ncbi:MAG: hypothetical protein ACOZBW_06340 [Thermodesulfobacteriota bacterium]
MRHSSLLADQEPEVPWHDTSAAYGIAAGFALAVMLFAGAGISMAGEFPDFGRHAWVPWLLMVLGLVILVTCGARLGRRLYLAIEKYRDKGPGIPL